VNFNFNKVKIKKGRGGRKKILVQIHQRKQKYYNKIGQIPLLSAFFCLNSICFVRPASPADVPCAEVTYISLRKDYSTGTAKYLIWQSH
jgi:hypothetical protein